MSTTVVAAAIPLSRRILQSQDRLVDGNGFFALTGVNRVPFRLIRDSNSVTILFPPIVIAAATAVNAQEIWAGVIPTVFRPAGWPTPFLHPAGITLNAATTFGTGYYQIDLTNGNVILNMPAVVQVDDVITVQPTSVRWALDELIQDI